MSRPKMPAWVKQDLKIQGRDLFNRLLELVKGHVVAIFATALTVTGSGVAVATGVVTVPGAPWNAQDIIDPPNERVKLHTLRVVTDDVRWGDVIFEDLAVTLGTAGTAVQAGDSTGAQLLTVSELWVVDSTGPDFQFVGSFCGETVVSGNLVSNESLSSGGSNPFPNVTPPLSRADHHSKGGATDRIKVGDGVTDGTPPTGPGEIDRLIFSGVRVDADWNLNAIRAGSCFFVGNRFGAGNLGTPSFVALNLGNDISVEYTGKMWDGSDYLYLPDSIEDVWVK